ncbi:MAG: hypothetical protein O3A10_15650 [Chloroflexi bacterium]|nr:hypothetical protein [Chloroflexota bacterium]MDA1147858.1 hypothetical protein [Chloroflexota bacterium]
MKREYRELVVDNDGDRFDTFSIDTLNELGEEEWELFHVNKLQDVSASNEAVGGTLIRTKRVVLWFKRPRAA